MAAGDIDPVIIPVRVAPDLSDFRTIEDAMRRARDLPGVGPSAAQAGAGGPAGMAGADAAATLSVRTLVREFQTLEGTLRTVNVQLERLGRQVVAMPGAPGAGGGAGGAAMPPLPGGAGAPGGAPPGAGGGLPQGGRPGAGTFDASQMLASMLYGSAGVLGVGLGIGAAFSEVSRMISMSRTFQESAFLAAQGGQGDPVRTAAAISRGILTPPPGSMYLAPSDAAVAASARLQQLGLPETGRGREYAEFGQQTGTPAAAIGAEVYQTFRKEKGLEFEVAARQVARDTGQGTAEVVDQLRQLIRMMARSEGTYQRTGAEREATVALLRSLGTLPGGVGKGPGGMAIVESMSAGMEGGGIGGLITMAAWQRSHPGMSAATPAGMQSLMEYRQAQANAIPVLQEAHRMFGPDPDIRALVLEKAFGVRAKVAGELGRGRITAAQAMALPTAEEAAADIQDRNKGAEEAPGGEALTLEQRIRRQREQDTWASRMWRGVQRGRAWVGPTGTTALEAVGGAALLWGGSRAAYGGYRAVNRGLGTAIRRAGGAGRVLGGVGGGIMLGTDAVQAQRGETNWPSLLGGLAGTAAGALLTRSPWGALAGYGVGAAGGRALGGLFGASSAEASLGPSAREAERGLGGWRRDEVLEHLALMRGLVMAPHMGGGTGTPDYGRAIPGGGPASSARVGAHAARLGGLPPALASGMETTAEKIMRMAGLHLDGGSARSSRDIVPYGDDISVEGRILPNDPRIVEAAERFGIPLKTFQRLIRQESGFQVNKRGRDAEYGLTQLLPGTAREMGVEHPMDPRENLLGGAGYLRKQIDYFKSQGMSDYDALQHALVAYNAGRGNAKKPGAVSRSEYPPALGLTEAESAMLTPGPQASREEQRRAIEERVLASHAPETASPEVRVRLELDQEIQGLVAARTPREGSYERSSR